MKIVFRGLQDARFYHHAGEGFDNAVYLVNRRFVFRFPRRSEAVHLIKREMLIVPKLASRLSLTIPVTLYFVVSSPSFSRPFYWHELILGTPGSALQFTSQQYHDCAQALGRFLSELHALDVTSLKLPSSANKSLNDNTDVERLMANCTKRLREVKSHYQLDAFQQKFDEIFDNALQYSPDPNNAVMVHGDLYHRHLIFNDPKDVHETFFAAYDRPVSQQSQHYARYLGLHLAIALLWFGHSRNDHDLIRTSFVTFEQI